MASAQKLPAERDLLAQHFLDLAELFLHLALDLTRIAFGFQTGIADRFAGGGFDFAGDVLGGASGFVLGGGFHFMNGSNRLRNDGARR